MKFTEIPVHHSPKSLYKLGRLVESRDYRLLSSQFTTWLKNYGIINVDDGLSVDHKYSVKHAYDNKLDCRVVNNINNIHIIPKKDNSIKSSKSIISIDELLSYDKDIMWDRFINDEHPIYANYTIENEYEKEYRCSSGFVADDWNREKIPRLFVTTIYGQNITFSLTVSSFDKLIGIKLNKPFIITNIPFTNNNGDIFYYKEFRQAGPDDLMIAI